MIVANDTDVFAIVVSTLSALQNIGLQQLWLVFDHGRNQRWLPVHALNSPIDQRLNECSSSMASLVAMLCRHSVERQRSLHGKPGECVLEHCVVTKLSQYSPTVEASDMKVLNKFVVTMLNV
jgi:hypothetical protein